MLHHLIGGDDMDTLLRALYVKNCGRESCEPGHRYGPAMRGYYLIHIAASGCGVFDNGIGRFDVRAGQGFAIFPEDIAVYTADSATPLDYVWVGFSGENAGELARSAGISHCHRACMTSCSASGRRGRDFGMAAPPLQL